MTDLDKVVQAIYAFGAKEAGRDSDFDIVEEAEKDPEGHERVVRLAQAAIDAMGWRPIEEAPKDGTLVDLWTRRSTGLSSGPGRIPDCWYSGDKWWAYDEHGDDQCRTEVVNVTHWMPRPPAPKEEA